MNIKRNMKALRKTCFLLDIANVVFSIFIIILGVLIIININAHIKLFPILFLIAFIMNLDMAFKQYLNSDKVKYITLLIVSALLLVITFIGFVATWGN